MTVGTRLRRAFGVEEGWFTAAQSGARAVYDAEAGQPKNVGYVQLAGVSGDYISTPDAPDLDVTGDLEIVVRVAMDDWTPSAVQIVVSKWNSTGNQRSFYVALNTNGTVALTTTADGSTQLTHTSTAAVPFADGAAGWVKITFDVDDGAGNRVARFYTATDQLAEPSAWTQLGTTVTAAGATSIFSGSAVLMLGSFITGATFLLAGKVYRAIVRAGIDGRTVADFNAADCYGPGYLNEGVLPVDSGGSTYVPLSGQSGDYVWTADKAALRITGDIEMVARVAMDDWSPASNVRLISRMDAGADRSYSLLLLTTGALYVETSEDGTSGTVRAGGATDNLSATPAGTALWVKMTLDVNDGAGNRVYNFYWAADQPTEPSSWTQLGTTVTVGTPTSIFAGARPLEVGSRASGTLDRVAGRIYRAIVRNGIAGTTVADFNAANADTFGLASDGVGNGWFIASPKHHGNWTLAIPKIYDTSGNGRAPAVFGAGSNQPLWLPWKGVAGVLWSLNNGSRINTPSNAAMNVTDLDVWVDFTVDSFVPTLISALAQRVGADPDRGFNFRWLTSGKLDFTWYPTGSLASAITVVTTPTVAQVAAASSGRIALRVTLDVDNGAGGYTMQFWAQPGGYVNDASWRLIETFTGGSTTALPAINRTLEFGNVGTGERMIVHKARMMASIGGAVLAEYDAARQPQTTGYTDPVGSIGVVWSSPARAATGEKMVVQSPAAFSARSVVLHRTDDWIDVPAAAVPALDTYAAPSGVAVSFRRWHNPGAAGHPIFTTKASSANTVLGGSIRLAAAAASTALVGVVGDGTNTDTPGDVSGGSLGERTVSTLIVGSSSPFVSHRALSASAVDASRATTVSTSTAGAGRIGAYLGGTAPIDMEFGMLATYDGDIPAGKHGVLVTSYRGGV